MDSRLGEAEEQLVRDYLADRDRLPSTVGPERDRLEVRMQSARDQIVAFCERFIKKFYKKRLKTVMLYEDFLQDAVIRVLEILDRFDPARVAQTAEVKNVSFIYWAMFNIDRFALAQRFKTKRYLSTHQYGMKRPLAQIPWEADFDGVVLKRSETSDAFIFESRVDRNALSRSVFQVVSRHTTENEIRLMRYIYRVLLQTNEFPTFRELMSTRFAKVMSHREIYKYLKYAIREVRMLLISACS